jgi:threonine dehydrogenase-like Zn-dependent dehydrogenase
LAYDPAEFADSFWSIAEGEIAVAPLTPARWALDSVGAAFDDLADPERYCKIQLTPSLAHDACMTAL